MSRHLVALFRKTQRTPTLGPKKRGTQEVAFTWTARNYTSIETPIQKISVEVSKSGKNSQSLSLKGSSSISVVNRVLAPRLLSAGMRTQLKWSPGAAVKVLGITLQDEENWVVSAAAKPVGICPDCGRRSRHRHGWHNRRLQDLPVQGQVVKIKLALNRWQCRHRKCGRRTFTRQVARDCFTLHATN